jgi:two-component system response regulator HydG
MQKLRILILYPDPAGLGLLTSMLKSLGHDIDEVANDRAAVRFIERNGADVLLAGVDPQDADALELLLFVRRKHREIPVVLLFPRIHPERTKQALKLGAAAALKYPVPAAELRAAVLQAVQMGESRWQLSPSAARTSAQPAMLGRSDAGGADTAVLATNSTHHSLPKSSTATHAPASSPGLSATYSIESSSEAISPHRIEQVARAIGLLGHDPSWMQAIELAATVATTRGSVLIVGEPGTGKSLLARLIHGLAGKPEKDRPFVTVEGSTLADQLSLRQSQGSSLSTALNALEWPNKLAQARGGTVYLREVAALPIVFQQQLLRELQFHEFEATAGHAMSLGQVRFLVSTSENLLSLIDQGSFRQELYHRISVISLMLPPLRHRGTDIELLADAFRARFADEFRKPVVGFSRDAQEVFQRHAWPGNVRELQEAVRRAVALCSGPRITSSHLAPLISHSSHGRPGATGPRPHLQMGVRPLKEALEEPEKRIIVQALQAFNWNRQETAKVLDINRTTLYNKMKKYNLLIGEPSGAN